jgi:hypothetical protein
MVSVFQVTAGGEDPAGKGRRIHQRNAVFTVKKAQAIRAPLPSLARGFIHERSHVLLKNAPASPRPQLNL